MNLGFNTCFIATVVNNADIPVMSDMGNEIIVCWIPPFFNISATLSILCPANFPLLSDFPVNS